MMKTMTTVTMKLTTMTAATMKTTTAADDDDDDDDHQHNHTDDSDGDDDDGDDDDDDDDDDDADNLFFLFPPYFTLPLSATRWAKLTKPPPRIRAWNWYILLRCNYPLYQ